MYAGVTAISFLQWDAKVHHHSHTMWLRLMIWAILNLQGVWLKVAKFEVDQAQNRFVKIQEVQSAQNGH